MGSGASTPASQKAEPKGTGADKSSRTKDAELLTQSPFDDIGAAGSPFADEDKGDDNAQKVVASATKLKRMAFGQQTYMDQQRDYDQTLNKLELNKSGVIDWSGPTSPEKGSPQKTPKGATPVPKGGKFPDSSFLSPGENKGTPTATPDGAMRAAAASRKPPPPAAGAGKAIVGAPQSVLSPTQQVVQAPSHHPTRGHPQPQPQPRYGQPTAPGGAEALYGHGHSASLTSVQAASQPVRNIQQYPDHNSSGTLLLHQHGHGGPQYPAASGGPPPGLISRPFPHHHLESNVSDVDDGMMADFTRSVKLPEIHKKPDNVPLLTMNNHSGSDLSSRVAPPRNNPQLGPALAVQTLNKAGGPSPLPGHMLPSPSPMPVQGSPSPQQFIRPATVGTGMPGNASPYPNGPRTPAMHPAGTNPSSGAPSPMIQPVRQHIGGAHAAPPSSAGGSGTRPQAAPVPPGAGAHLNAPVVKETKNVKRNRAQIPTQLAHALPTQGDWMNKRYIVNNYILLEVLGTGSYGEVRSRRSCFVATPTHTLLNSHLHLPFVC
jgi:hypothetical protein